MNISIMELFKSSWKNIYRNKFTYVTNATILQFLILGAGMFVVKEVFELVLLLSGQQNLEKDNILKILLNPISLLGIVLLILIVAFLMFVEFSTLTFTIYGQLTGTNFTAKEIGQNAWKKIKTLVGVQILFFIGYFVLMVPLANLGMGSILTEQLYIPKFITGEVMKTTTGMLGYGAAMLVLFYINVRLMFTLPLTVINDDKLVDNIKRSWILTKKGKFKMFVVFAMFEALITLIASLVLVVAFIAGFLLDSDGGNLLIQTGFYTVLTGILFFFGVLSKVAIITVLVTIIVEEGYVSEKLISHKQESKKSSRWFLALTTVLFLGGLGYNSLIIYATDVNKDTMTIGHRGYVSKGVENSLESLEGAAKAGVSYVELDILLTKDNKFVVMHDYNLKRLAGVDKRVQDMTYDEVVGLTIKQDGHEGKIPSFEEFVAKAKELNVKLLVELKPHGGEPDNYVDLVIAKARELGIDKEYKYMSLDLKVMEQLESKAPEFDTGYVIPLMIGDFANNNVDFFVIEDFSYNESSVLKAQSKNKQVFVWTINEEQQMIKYLESPVNAVITDNPEQVNNIRKDLEKNNSYLDKVMRKVQQKLSAL